MLLNSSVHQSDSVIHIYIYGLPWWLNGKESTCNVEDLGSVPGLGRSPGEGQSNLFQYFCLENPHGQRNLVGFSPWGLKESDRIE